MTTDLRTHLRTLMQERGETIKSLAAKLNIRRATLSDYLNNKHAMSTDIYERALHILGSNIVL